MRSPRSWPWRHVGAVVAVAALVTALASWHLAIRADGAGARQELSATAAELEQALAAEAAATHAIEATSDELDAARVAIGFAEAAAALDRDSAAALRAAAEDLARLADETAVELFGTADLLGRLRLIVEARGVQIADLQRCVSGVLAAAESIQTGHGSAAVAQLEAVRDPCGRAQHGASAGAGGIVFPFDFPDPFVLRSGSTYHAYATNSAGGAIQLIRSADLVSWELVGAALPAVPAWATPGATWAPSVLPRGDRFLLYYAVRQASSGRQCLSVAVADNPAGPFVDTSSGPLVCELGEGGSIDPSPFVTADGRAFLLWKSEGETTGGVAAIRAQPLRGDGLAVEGQPVELLRTAAAWEGRTIEAPSMVSTSAGLVLLYAGNSWNRASYATGAALCDGPLGPCQRQPGPVLATSGATVGPGGAEAFVDGSGTVRVAYHAWTGANVGYPHGRFLHIGTLRIEAGRVVVTP